MVILDVDRVLEIVEPMASWPPEESHATWTEARPRIVRK